MWGSQKSVPIGLDSLAKPFRVSPQSNDIICKFGTITPVRPEKKACLLCPSPPRMSSGFRLVGIHEQHMTHARANIEMSLDAGEIRNKAPSPVGSVKSGSNLCTFPQAIHLRLYREYKLPCRGTCIRSLHNASRAKVNFVRARLNVGKIAKRTDWKWGSET